MKDIYVIIMVCVDDDKIYSDYVNKTFTDLEKAKIEMVKCAIAETESLDNAEMVNFEDEIVIYIDNEMVTKYSIIKVGVENE